MRPPILATQQRETAAQARGTFAAVAVYFLRGIVKSGASK
jgi:hypothetical protein